jgi:hypothetical protein
MCPWTGAISWWRTQTTKSPLDFHKNNMSALLAFGGVLHISYSFFFSINNWLIIDYFVIMINHDNKNGYMEWLTNYSVILKVFIFKKS